MRLQESCCIAQCLGYMPSPVMMLMLHAGMAYQQYMWNADCRAAPPNWTICCRMCWSCRLAPTCMTTPWCPIAASSCRCCTTKDFPCLLLFPFPCLMSFQLLLWLLCGLVHEISNMLCMASPTHVRFWCHFVHHWHCRANPAAWRHTHCSRRQARMWWTVALLLATRRHILQVKFHHHLAASLLGGVSCRHSTRLMV